MKCFCLALGLLLGVSGCASHRKGMSLQIPETIRIEKNILTSERKAVPLNPEVSQIYQNKVGQLTNPKSVAMAAFESVCENGKQRAPLKATVYLVIPQFSRGVTLDVLKRARGKFITEHRNVMKSFFWLISDAASYARPESLKGRVLRGDGSGAHDEVWGLTTRDLGAELKLQQWDPKRGESVTGIFQGPGGIIYVGQLTAIKQLFSDYRCSMKFGCEASILSRLDDTDSLYLVPKPDDDQQYVETLFYHYGTFARGGGKYEDGSSILVGASLGAFRPLDFGIKLNSGSFFPLESITYDFPAALVRNFVFLFPRLYAEKTFRQQEWGLVYPKNCSELAELGFDRAECRAAPGSAMLYHMHQWWEYFRRFTSVREQATTDPQMIRYDLSLDLNGFCAYGRAKADLVTN